MGFLKSVAVVIVALVLFQVLLSNTVAKLPKIG
jgi:hypothetical protein